MTMAWTSGRKMKVTLIASLALNLFLVGYLVGRAADVWSAKEKRGDSFVERLASRLPAADADVVRRAAAQRQPEIDKLMADYRKTRQDVRAALSAPAFNAKALESAFEESRKRRLALELAIQDLVLSSAGDLSADGRANLFPPRRGR